MRSRCPLFLILLIAASCRSFAPPPKTSGPRIGAVDGGDRPIEQIEIGSSLEMTGDGLVPRTLYEYRLTLDDQLISFSRVTTDARGVIAPFVLWYHSGVIGCATRPADEKRVLKFRTFDEAESALRGKRLRITARAMKDDQNVIAFELPIATRRSAMVYPSNAAGCLVNALETQKSDLYISGRNFNPGETVVLSVVPNQRAWYTGDRVLDVTGVSSAAAPKRVQADASGRFTTPAWDSINQRRGVYDIVAQRLALRVRDLAEIDRNDIVSYGSDSALILFLYYPPGGPNMDIAGRPLLHTPYFEFADSFADTSDNVWGAVDPTYVPAMHPGGIFAAYYVVNHRTPQQWDPMMGGSTAIADISSNGVEVQQVKAGCVNVTDVIIWPAPVPIGQYDVVVDFGSTVANLPADWTADNQYDSAFDFLDGAVQVGFQVAHDPWDLGPEQVGQASYSFDDQFNPLGAVANVDLRAVIRYPATAAGLNQPVTAGTHPLFVIEHGNHSYCHRCSDNSLWYDRLKAAILANNFTTFINLCIEPAVTKTNCLEREKNHEGYMRLLETLASHGIIAVSIDAYDLMGPPLVMNERADLILKNIGMMAHLNNPADPIFSTFPSAPFGALFNGHVDLSKISISGHSRGGEAAVVAYLRNQVSMNPFSINSVSSIAPTDFSPSPILPAVPYYVFFGAADGDLSDLNGATLYDRAGSTIADATTKSQSYIYGANHNFFNTVWAGEFDDYADGNPTFAVRNDFIAAADQQRLGESYVAAFVRTHLLNEVIYEDMFRGGLTFPSTAGFKIYGSRHETQHAKLDAGSGGSLVALGGGVKATVMNPSVHLTQALQLGWPSNAAIFNWSVPLAQQDTTAFEVISFRVAQTSSASNPMSGNQDFMVELVGGGQTRATYVGQFDAVPKPYSRPDLVHNVMTTVRVPLHSFIMNNSQVTLNAIDTVRIRFGIPTTGEIYVDDLEFSR
jgi:hypothetical protein